MSRGALSETRPWIVYRATRVLYRFVTDENYRNSALVRLAPPRNLFQPDNYTEPDRYPDLFRLAAREIGDGPEKQILSFGCSTGEEVFALRGCFPTAHIHGIDINRRNIAVCNRKLAEDPDPAIDFRTAGSAAGEDPDSYDAIFCMAIFRHGALGDRVRDRCDDLIRFQDFDNAIADLTRALKRGGLLFIENSHFRFSDTSAFPDFEVVGEARREQRETDGPIYDRDNRLIAGVNDRDIAFRKAKRRAR